MYALYVCMYVYPIAFGPTAHEHLCRTRPIMVAKSKVGFPYGGANNIEKNNGFLMIFHQQTGDAVVRKWSAVVRE